MNKGFTLVELSIVLVIIGLLVGGIIAAQSMISTARMQKFVGQISSFDTAVTNFHNMYQAYPGDAPAFGGDGDRSIGPDLNTYDAEKRNFWPNLQATGLKAEKDIVYSNTITTTFTKEGSTPNSPKMEFVSNTGIVPYTHNSIQYYMLSSFTMSSSYSFSANIMASMTGTEAKGIDTKMDDGGHYTGIVRALGPFVVNDTVANPCVSSGRYNTSSGNNCNLRIEMAPYIAR